MSGLFIGQKAMRQRRFTSADVAAYRELSGDVSLRYAAENAQNKSVPGPLLGGLISELLGTTLPGRGTNWLKQRYVFHEPAIVDQLLAATVEITRLRPEKSLVNLSITINGPAGERICSGESLVLVPDWVGDGKKETPR